MGEEAAGVTIAEIRAAATWAEIKAEIKAEIREEISEAPTVIAIVVIDIQRQLLHRLVVAVVVTREMTTEVQSARMSEIPETQVVMLEGILVLGRITAAVRVATVVAAAAMVVQVVEGVATTAADADMRQ